MLLQRLFDGQLLGKSFCSCAPTPPAAPDYVGAAKDQGEANIKSAITQGKINNPNVINPYGTQTVDFGKRALDAAAYNKAQADWAAKQRAHMNRYGVPIPEAAYREGYRPPNPNDFMVGGDQPTITQTFSPEQQAIFDKSNQTKLALSDLALRGSNVAGDVLGKNLDLTTLPARPGSAEETRNKVMDAMMARVNEDVDRKKEQVNSNLLAAGIPTSSKAYNDAMALEERNRTDARTQALLASGQEMTRDFQTDSNRRRDALAEMLTERQTPLNEITALMSGSQVQNPFAVPQYAQNAQVQPAPLFGATQQLGNWNSDLYNVNAAQAGNLQSGLFGLGGAAIQGGSMGLAMR